MDHHPTVTCTACERPFSADIPMSRQALAASSLMFLVEVCPHCDAVRTYLRSDYRFAATV